MVKWLESTANCVQSHGAAAKVRVGIDARLRVDGQIDIEQIPRNYTIRNLLLDTEECWAKAIKDDPTDIEHDFFAQVGFDLKTPVEQKSADRRYRGVDRYLLYWFHLSKAFKMFEMARDGDGKKYLGLDNLLRRYRRPKPFRVFFRLHWNVTDQTPGSKDFRRGKPGDKRDGKGPRR